MCFLRAQRGVEGPGFLSPKSSGKSINFPEPDTPERPRSKPGPSPAFCSSKRYAQVPPRSIQCYTSAVLKLQRFYNLPLEDISEEQLRQYWLSCQNELGWSAATLRISYSGIQHFFSRTLVRSWDLFNEIQWKREETLPTILSLEEVRKIIYALPTQQSLFTQSRWRLFSKPNSKMR